MSELFRSVLNTSLQGSIVIAVVLLLRLVLGKAPKRYICLLWILAGLRLLCPFTIESELSLQPEAQIVTQAEWEDLRDFGRILPADAPKDLGFVDTTAEAEPREAQIAEPDVTGTVTYTPAWAVLAPYLWLTGAGLLAACSLISYLKLKRRTREAVHLFGDVWERDGVDTAIILGFWRPKILLPTGIAPASRKFILEHESCHLKRGDHWVKLLGFLAVVLHWFNPLVWLAYALLCRDVEMACDECVVRNMDLEERKRYSAALLECSANRTHWASCMVAFGEVSVKQRIMKVLRYRKPAFWLSAVGVFAAVFVALCFLTDPAGEERIRSGSDDWEAEIRGVLEEIQSRDYYEIAETRTFEGEDILNEKAELQYLRAGERWQMFSYIPDSGDTMAYMGLDGVYYEVGYNPYYETTEEPPFDWEKVENAVLDGVEMTDDHVFDPWLYAFNLDAHDADAISRWETGEGYVLRLLVHEDWNGWGDSYHVDFCFDQNGDFSNAVLYAGSEEGNKMECTMFLRETDRQTVLGQIQSNSGSTVKALDEGPDWGLRMYVTEVSAQSLRLHCERSGGDWPGDLMTGRHWWVEKWNGGQWEVLETRPDIAWETDAQIIGPDASVRWNCSFEWAYGPLEPGTYRIGKSFSNVPQYKVGIEQSMEEIDRTYYAEFEITE